MPTLRLYSGDCPMPLPRQRAAPVLGCASAEKTCTKACLPAEPAPPPPKESAFTMPPSKNLDEHLDRSDSWIDKQQVFDRQDARSIHHRDKLDERAATVRMRVEGLHHELVEMVAEYKLLQEGDDAHETERWSEYEALCADADAVAAPHPACPRSVALHYDSSLPLRDGATHAARAPRRAG